MVFLVEIRYSKVGNYSITQYFGNLI